MTLRYIKQRPARIKTVNILTKTKKPERAFLFMKNGVVLNDSSKIFGNVCKLDLFFFPF